MSFLYLLFLPFQVLSFSKSECLDFITNISGSDSPYLSPLDYQVWGQCWSLITSCNGKKYTLVDLVCFTGESH